MISTEVIEQATAVEPWRGLTKRKRDVAEYIVTDGVNRTEACRRAGYAEKSANRQAWRLFNDQRFMAYLEHIVWLRVGEGTAMAAGTMVRLLASRDEKVSLRAAQDLMDRGGVKQAEKVDVSGTINVRFDLA